MDSQVMKDDIKAAHGGEIKEYIEMQLNCVMHIMASGHLRQNNDKVEKDGITTYLDVTKWLHCFLEAVVATIDFHFVWPVVNSK